MDKGASIRGPIKAIDHTYASVEIRNGYVANLQDALKGLKLALRGRIKLRSDLLYLGQKPEESLKKIDEYVEDVMWHAMTSVANSIYESIGEKEKIGEELKSLFSTDSVKLAEKLLEYPELNKVIRYIERIENWELNNTIEYNQTEKNLIYYPDKTDPKILEEYHFSAVELVSNIEAYSEITKTLAKERIFTPKKLEGI